MKKKRQRYRDWTNVPWPGNPNIKTECWVKTLTSASYSKKKRDVHVLRDADLISSSEDVNDMGEWKESERPGFGYSVEKEFSGRVPDHILSMDAAKLWVDTNVPKKF